MTRTAPEDHLLNIVQKLTKRRLDLQHYAAPLAAVRQAVDARLDIADGDDWRAVQSICGYRGEDFTAAGATLPLTAAAIQHFCRNHRECDMSLGGQFEALGNAMPEPLAILYSVYLSQTRLDAEGALFLAQASGSTRVAGIIADLLTIGAFNHGAASVHCEGRIFAVSAAFDTAAIIDATNREAEERLALPAGHNDHLLRLTPDAIGLLAMHLAAQHRLSAEALLEKSNRLAEARQDVNRLAPADRFITAVFENDLPAGESWVARILDAMRRIIPAWAGSSSIIHLDQAYKNAA